MARVEVVVHLCVDLTTVGIAIAAVCQTEVAVIVPAAYPLVKGGIQSVATIEQIRVRHETDVFLRNAQRVGLRSERIPRISADLSIRTVRPRGRICYGSENAEVA